MLLFVFVFFLKQPLVCNGWHRSAFRQTARQADSKSLVVTRAGALQPPVPASTPCFCLLNPELWVNEKGLDHREKRQSAHRHLCSPPALWDPLSMTGPLPCVSPPHWPFVSWVTPHRLAAQWPPKTPHPVWHYTKVDTLEKRMMDLWDDDRFCVWRKCDGLPRDKWVKQETSLSYGVGRKKSKKRWRKDTHHLHNMST